MFVLICVMGFGVLLVGCSGEPSPTPTQPPINTPPNPPIPPTLPVPQPTVPEIPTPEPVTPTPSPPNTPAPSPTLPPTATPTPCPTPSNTPTPFPTPTDEDVTATARAAALETGGEFLWGDQRDQALIAISSVIHNRVGSTIFSCITAAECASDTFQFQAVGRNPSYEPTEHERNIARAVLSQPRSQGFVGNSVYFHDFTALPGAIVEYELASPTPGFGFYFYTADQCPGGPRGGGVGCSYVPTPTPGP